MRSEKEIRSDIDFHQIKIKTFEQELRAVQNAKSKNNRNSYKARKDLLDYTSFIFESILKPGDLVKVTGSRASAYRQVKEIVTNNWGCSTLASNPCYLNPYTGGIIRIDTNTVICCGTNKIIAVVQDGKWVTAQELYKRHNQKDL